MAMAFVARILTLLALVVAPLGMMQAHAATPIGGDHSASKAMATTASGGHCADRDRHAPQPDKASIDCTIACAGVASLFTPVPARPTAPVSVVVEIRPVATLHGLHPESDPPPPRLA
jgi:hypothetical protein